MSAGTPRAGETVNDRRGDYEIVGPGSAWDRGAERVARLEREREVLKAAIEYTRTLAKAGGQ